MSPGLWERLGKLFSSSDESKKLYFTSVGRILYGYCQGNGQDLIQASSPQEFAQKAYAKGYHEKTMVPVGEGDIPEEFEDALGKKGVSGVVVRPHKSNLLVISTSIGAQLEAKKALALRQIREAQARKKAQTVTVVSKKKEV